MTLRREEAQTGNHYVRVMSFGVSVIACDHIGAKGRCDAGYLIGIGDGDSISSDDIDAAEADGWSIGDCDYCPEHADDEGEVLS